MRVIETVRTSQCPRCGKPPTRCRCDLKKSIRQRTKCVFSYISPNVADSDKQSSNEAPCPQSFQLTIQNPLPEITTDDDVLLAENNIICPRCVMNLTRSQKSPEVDQIGNTVCQHCMLRAQIYKLKAEKRQSRLRSRDDHYHTKHTTKEEKLEIIYLSKQFQTVLTESKQSCEGQDAAIERTSKETELNVLGKTQKYEYSRTELNKLRPKSMPADLTKTQNMFQFETSFLTYKEDGEVKPTAVEKNIEFNTYIGPKVSTASAFSSASTITNLRELQHKVQLDHSRSQLSDTCKTDQVIQKAKEGLKKPATVFKGNQLTASSSQEIMSYLFPIASKNDSVSEQIISSELIRRTREKLLDKELEKKQKERETILKRKLEKQEKIMEQQQKANLEVEKEELTHSLTEKEHKNERETVKSNLEIAEISENKYIEDDVINERKRQKEKVMSGRMSQKQKREEENVASKQKKDKGEVPKRKMKDEEEAAKRKKEKEDIEKNNKKEEADKSKKNAEEEAEKSKKKEKEEADKRKIKEEADRKKIGEEEDKKKNKDEAAEKKKKEDEEAAKKKKTEQEIAENKRKEDRTVKKEKNADISAIKGKEDMEALKKKKAEEERPNKEQQKISNKKEDTEATKKEKVAPQVAKQKIEEDTNKKKKEGKEMDKKDDKKKKFDEEVQTDDLKKKNDKQEESEKVSRDKRPLQTESELMIFKLIKEHKSKRAEDRVLLAEQNIMADKQKLTDMSKKKMEGERKKLEEEQAQKTKLIEETFKRRTQENLLAASSAVLEVHRESKSNKALKSRQSKITDIIIGEDIFQTKLPLPPDPLLQDMKEPVAPLLFKKKSVFSEPLDACPEDNTKHEEERPKDALTSDKKADTKNTPSAVTERQERKDGIFRYALSNRSYIENGWTVLPVEEVVRKMNVYRMRPAQPEFDWFEHNKNKRRMEYNTGEKLAVFDDNGGCRWYYKNGRLALDYYNSEELNSQHRFVVYSNGKPDERGRSRPYTVLATFSHLGTGVVFDHGGKIRLKYNQTEGVLLDREIGPVTTWKWHSLNDPPVLRQVMINSKLIHKDQTILRLGEKDDHHHRKQDDLMIAIENENSLKEMRKKQSLDFKPFQIKTKALKINENFSLKVLDQTTIYLIFREGSVNIKLNIGMLLDHREIVDTDTTSLGVISNCIERLPAATDSIEQLQRSVEHARRFERNRTARDRLIRPPLPEDSADRLIAGLSRPLKVPLKTMSISQTASKICCSRKPPCNLYYNSRLP